VLLNAIADDLPLAISWVTFTPNNVSLGDQEMQKEWLPTCFSFEVIEAFAQTRWSRFQYSSARNDSYSCSRKQGRYDRRILCQSIPHFDQRQGMAWPLGQSNCTATTGYGMQSLSVLLPASAIGRYDSVYHLFLASEATGKRPHDSCNEATVGMARCTCAYLRLYYVQAGLEQEAQKSTLVSAELNFSRSCGYYFAL
jgi:hypothetical protein